MMRLYSPLPRQGPGSIEATARALSLIPNLPDRPQILDIGCGTGTQTLALAKLTGGMITAVDVFPEVLDILNGKIRDEGLSDSVHTHQASMDALDFEEGAFDLIWSEGAIYIMGFAEGMRAWRRFLKPGGYIAVTEISWLKDNPPEEPRKFWETSYPGIANIQKNLSRMEEAGYQCVGHFSLPESTWWDEYYFPLEVQSKAFMKKFKDVPEAKALAEEALAEINLYRRYAEWYSYVFFIGRKI